MLNKSNHFSLCGSLFSLGVLLATGFSAQAAVDPGAGGVIPDACSAAIDAVNIQTVVDPSFMSSTHDIRVMTLCQFKDAILVQYSNLDLKAERIKNPDGSPFDGTAHLNQCIQTENAVTNDDSDLHFIDRTSQCMAAFQDTHFWMATPIAVPPVFAGFMVTNVGGHYYISQVMPDVMNYVNNAAGGDPAIGQAIVPGNEVTLVDGQTPAALSAIYKTYLSGSSDDFNNMQADSSIFERTFAYPTSNTVDVKITDASGNNYELKMPWWGGIGAHTRLDSNSYFASLNIPVSDRVKMQLDANGLTDWRKAQLQTIGYDPSKPLFTGDTFNPMITYNDDTGAPGLVVGEVQNGKTDFCYMQLLTFETVNFTAPDKSAASFADTIRNFVANCKAKNLNLVIDLRANGGGNGSFPDVLLSIIAPAGSNLQAPVMAFRITPDIGRLLASDGFQPEINFEDMGAFENNPLDAFNAAAAAGQRESMIIPNQANPVDPVVGGYSGKVLAIVSPYCISACDMTASLLKKSGRATLIGTHSNGTGAGFLSSPTLNSTFQDANDEFAIKIPNFLFGVPDVALDTTKGYAYAQYKDTYLLENKPTVADIQYATTHDDLDPTNPGKGWRAAVLKAVQSL
jgi:hypothetical protein